MWSHNAADTVKATLTKVLSCNCSGAASFMKSVLHEADKRSASLFGVFWNPENLRNCSSSSSFHWNASSAVPSSSALWETPGGAAGLRPEDHRCPQWPHTAGAQSEQRGSERLGGERQRRLPLRRHHPLQRASQVSSGFHRSNLFFFPLLFILGHSSISQIRRAACFCMLRKNQPPQSVGSETFFLFFCLIVLFFLGVLFQFFTRFCNKFEFNYLS